MPTTTRSDNLRSLADFLDEHPFDDITVTTANDLNRLSFHAQTVEAALALLDVIGAEGWQPATANPWLRHDGPLLGFDWVTLFVPEPERAASPIPAEILAVLA